MHTKMLRIISMGLLLVACNSTPPDGKMLDPSQALSKTEFIPTPDPLAEIPEEFRDLTIPYLRNQTYPGSDISIQSSVSPTSWVAAYQSEDLTIYGLLLKPSTPMPATGYPAVVFLHGYIPPLQYRTLTNYTSYAQALANQGLVVFKIDLRGHDQSQGEPSGAYYSSSYITDTLNAYESLKTLDYVDATKIGLWGHSMAGNIVLRSMAVKPEIPAGVIWAGAVYTYEDMREYGIQDNSYQPTQNPNRNRRQRLMVTVGNPEDNTPFWQLVAPTNFIADLHGKLQIHHATNDPVVSIEYSRNLQRIFTQAGKSLDLHEYASGGHNLEGSAFNNAMQTSGEFYLEP